MFNNNRKGLSEEGYDLYRTYTAIKTHFNDPSYNYFAYNGAISAPRSAYASRTDAPFFTELAKQSKDPFNLILSNIVSNPSIWIGDIEPDLDNRIYKSWRKTNDRLIYTFEQDLKQLKDELKDNFIIDEEGEYPYILRAFVGKKITFETFTLINKFLSPKGLQTRIDDPVFAPKVFDRAGKYHPFIIRDNVRDSIKKAIKDRWPIPSIAS